MSRTRSGTVYKSRELSATANNMDDTDRAERNTGGDSDAATGNGTTDFMQIFMEERC